MPARQSASDLPTFIGPGDDVRNGWAQALRAVAHLPGAASRLQRHCTIASWPYAGVLCDIVDAAALRASIDCRRPRRDTDSMRDVTKDFPSRQNSSRQPAQMLPGFTSPPPKNDPPIVARRN